MTSAAGRGLRVLHLTQAQAEGSARSFNLSVNELEGNYSFNVAMPDAKGVFKREEHVRRSGHCQPKNNEPYDRSTNEPYTLKGESFSISGEKIDPNDPDHLSGTKPLVGNPLPDRFEA